MRKISGNVFLGENVKIQDFVLIGLPAKKMNKTIIGRNSKIRSHTVIYSGNKIGENFQTGHYVLIREDNKIGDNVSVGSFSNIEHHVVIEDNVRVHSKVFIPEFCILKKGCWIGPGVVLTNAKYPNNERTKELLKGVEIGEGAIVGAGSLILPGVEIGEGAIVGAGSVVTKSVPKGKIVFGNPAKVIKNVNSLKYKDIKKRVYNDKTK